MYVANWKDQKLNEGAMDHTIIGKLIALLSTFSFISSTYQFGCDKYFCT